MKPKPKRPPPRIVPPPRSPPRPPDPVADAVAEALRRRDEIEELEQAYDLAKAQFEEKRDEALAARDAADRAIENLEQAASALGDAAEAYLNARAEAQALGGAMPGETPRTVRLFEMFGEDELEDVD